MRSVMVREFGGPEVMKIENVPDLSPSASQVLIHVRAAGVNPVDGYIRTGNYAVKPSLPYTPGLDGAGEVACVGTDVKDLKPRDRVYFFHDNTTAAHTGAYAEQIVCAATQVRKLPPSVSFSQGAAVGVLYGTAYYALFKCAKARPGEVVLVHGASGGVGMAAVQVARAHGMTVIGTAGSEKGLAALHDLGTDLVLNHKEQGYLDAISKWTAGRGVDVIVETNAHLNLEKDLGQLARLGRVVVVGSRGRIEIDPRATMAREAAIFGMALLNAATGDLQWIHAAIGAGLANGSRSSGSSYRSPTPPRHTIRSRRPARSAKLPC